MYCLRYNNTVYRNHTNPPKITRMMYSIEKCFNTKFWTGTAYRSPGYHGKDDDRSQAMAVLSGLATKDKYPAILKVLKKEYHASPYMEKYVLEALFQMNAPEVACFMQITMQAVINNRNKCTVSAIIILCIETIPTHRSQLYSSRRSKSTGS